METKTEEGELKNELNPSFGFEFYNHVLGAPKFIVAPMVDQSELAWRLLCRKHGAQLCYTPMLHAAVFLRQESYRQEALSDTCATDRPLIVQFCANDPDTLVSAALLAQDYCDAVDLNLGCPQSIAKRGNYGAFLQDNWTLVYDLINRCHKELKVPITAKIRIFPEREHTLEYARMLQRAGAQLLTVHGRTREQKGVMTGLADWRLIQAVREIVSIPVVSNGNIESLDDVKRCISETGVCGVMSAEGILHNPYLFQGVSPPIWEPAEEYLALVRQYPTPISYVRAHLFKLFHHALFFHPEIRETLGTTRSLDILSECVSELRRQCETVAADPDLAAAAARSCSLSLPYWLCQPYRRPQPSVVSSKRRTAAQAALEGDRLAAVIIAERKKRKLEKQKRREALAAIPASSYTMCLLCRNSKGQKCQFSLCRKCCATKTTTEKLDCVGHNHCRLGKEPSPSWCGKNSTATLRERFSQLDGGASASDIT